MESTLFCRDTDDHGRSESRRIGAGDMTVDVPVCIELLLDASGNCGVCGNGRRRRPVPLQMDDDREALDMLGGVSRMPSMTWSISSTSASIETEEALPLRAASAGLLILLHDTQMGQG